MYRAITALRAKGFRAACQLVFHGVRRRYLHWESRRFDQKYTVDTHERLLDFTNATVAVGDKASATIYEATPPRVFGRLIASLSIDPREFTFIDLGSGKGRVLLLASLFPFKQIIGVEFAQELHLQAQRNIGIYRPKGQRCRHIASIYGDAAAYRFPEGNLLIFVFYAFQPPLLKRVIENIVGSYAENPRQIYVVFYYPLEDASALDIFDESGLLSRVHRTDRVRRFPFWLLSRYDFAVYETPPIGARRPVP